MFFSCSVTAVFCLEEEGKELAFQRSVQGSSSEYRINCSVNIYSLITKQITNNKVYTFTH